MEQTNTNLKNAFDQLFNATQARASDDSLKPDSTATPFSTFFWKAIHYMETLDEAEKIDAVANFADDIEWDMMNNGQVRKGKEEVVAWCFAGGFGSKKEPVVIRNIATKEWGVWEYWNIGTLEEGIIEFARQSKWPFPADPKSLIGRTYRIPVSFIYHINAEGKIDLVDEYLDTQSLMAQFK